MTLSVIRWLSELAPHLIQRFEHFALSLHAAQMAAHRIGISRAGKLTVRLGSPGQIADPIRTIMLGQQSGAERHLVVGLGGTGVDRCHSPFALPASCH